MRMQEAEEEIGDSSARAIRKGTFSAFPLHRS